MKVWFGLLLFAKLAITAQGTKADDRTCIGTESGLSRSVDRLEDYSRMFKTYVNCTRVKGNLEITAIENPMMDVSFLKNIREVTGYVIIALNYVPYLSLENLRIIRGRQLYRNYSLYITANYNPDTNEGLKELRFKSLTEISRGNVLISKHNKELCFAETIVWDDIIDTRVDGRKVTIDAKSPQTCGSCSNACNGHCWGKTADMCQQMTLTNCSSACGTARCYGPRREECCNSQCAAGCTGPRNTDCFVCQHVNNGGACEHSCPPEYIFDPRRQIHVKNPSYKLTYDEQCIDKCPDNLLVDRGTCVKFCQTKGYRSDGKGSCVKCEDQDCDKECYGVKNLNGPLASTTSVDSNNVKYFRHCNIVKGNLMFMPYAFLGDNYTNTPALTSAMIKENFKDMKVITGLLRIHGWPKDLSDFSAFENLKTIDGGNLHGNVASLLIGDTRVAPYYMGHITSLGFTSLKEVMNGNVYIGYMRNLCYDRLVNWTSILKSPKVRRGFDGGVMSRDNKPRDQCLNVTCDVQCMNGCWGPGPHQCLACRNYSYQGTCYDGCRFDMGVYEMPGDKECKACDPHCNFTCVGPGPGNCSSCKIYRDGRKCVDECPVDKYPDPISKECKPCHNNCAIHEYYKMCTGPNNVLGAGGCSYCSKSIYSPLLNQSECLSVEQSCPEGYYRVIHNKLLHRTSQACLPCHKSCVSCPEYFKRCRKVTRSPALSSILIPIIVIVCAAAALGLVCKQRHWFQLWLSRIRSVRLI